MRLLTELLNQYAQSGIPAMALGYSSGSDDDESLFYIEDSWRQIVESPEVKAKSTSAHVAINVCFSYNCVITITLTILNYHLQLCLGLLIVYIMLICT